MQLRTLGLAVAAGVAASVVVGVAVTEVSLRWIEFSQFVGLPARLVAGIVVVAAVSLGLAADAPARRRAAGAAAGCFGVGFPDVFVVAGAVGSVGAVVALVLSVMVVVGGVTYASGGGVAGRSWEIARGPGVTANPPFATERDVLHAARLLYFVVENIK